MKKKLLFAICFLAFFNTQAQVDLKICPVGLLFESFLASVETDVSESFGLDADVVGIDGFWGFNLSGKYYFDPQKRIDGFHAGAFLGNIGDAVGIGFLAGYKLVSSKNVIFEVGLGVGRSFGDYIVGYGKFHLGYRIGKKKAVAAQTQPGG